MTQPGAAAGDHASPAPALELRNLSKTFGGERALQGADLVVAQREVHGLLGQNGSGKSTLIKVLAGYHEPDPGGELFIGGRPVPLPMQPGAFRRHGISFVHQHLGLIPALTVVENLFMGELASRRRWRISWAKERERARTIFARYGLDLDPRAVVAKLSPVQRALLAIVRAVEEMGAADGEEVRHGGLLVLDEPTPFLPRQDVEQLFRLVREIVARGASVIFVSHDVDEVLEITDRATVLRDGLVAGTLVTPKATKQDFIEMIVGRKLEAVAPQPHEFRDEKLAARIQGLSGGTVRDVTIGVRPGEIVGLTGLIGSGFDEVPYLAFGAVPALTGTLDIGGRWFDLTGFEPVKAMSAGIVLIPGDRLGSAVVGNLPVADNVTLPVLGSRFNPVALNRRRMLEQARRLGQDFQVVPNVPSMMLESLSGGNQQKVVLAKWLQTKPALILLDEPTQGVDIGARQTVYRAIRRAAEEGAAVLCASSDYEQLATICDRVLVFSRGEILGELIGSAISKEAIAEQCYQSIANVLHAEGKAEVS